MQQIYLLPIEVVIEADGTEQRGPKYLTWRYDPDPPGIDTGPRSMRDYGFVDSAVVLVHDMLPANHTLLIQNADVFAFPTNLDQPVPVGSVDQAFEGIHLPTNWMNPSTSYRELLRQTLGMFFYNIRYGEISAQDLITDAASIFDNATLETRLRDMAAQEQTWFLATAASYGISPGSINTNQKLRTLVKQAGNLWAGQQILLGGVAI